MTLIVTVTIRKTLKATARKRKIEINIVIVRELGTLTETMKLTDRNREIGSESDNDSDNVMTV